MLELLMMSAVRRVHEPGCRLDHGGKLITFIGPNAAEFIETLAPRPEWHALISPRLRGRRMAEQLRDIWFAEVQDLEAVTRELIARTHDAGIARQCVLVGTAREMPTRRLGVLNCIQLGNANLDALRRDRDQLWAEIGHRHPQPTH